MKKKKTEVCEKTFAKMWLAGTPTRVIAETLRISADRCDATRRSLGLPRRESWHNSKAGKRRAYLPSLEEIRARCLEFQAGWTDEERAKRLVGGSAAPLPVEIRVISESVFHGDSDGLSIEDLIDTSGR
jgi:hypothetical protein